jgi:hypothetical protein
MHVKFGKVLVAPMGDAVKGPDSSSAEAGMKKNYILHQQN